MSLVRAQGAGGDGGEVATHSATRMSSALTRVSPGGASASASATRPRSTKLSPRTMKLPMGTSPNLSPTTTRSTALTSTMFENWSKLRSVPITFRPSRRITSSSRSTSSINALPGGGASCGAPSGDAAAEPRGGAAMGKEQWPGRKNPRGKK